MTELFRDAIGNLQEAWWTYEPPMSVEDDVPSPLLAAPPVAIRWASAFSRLSRSDEKAWFLSRDDYSPDAAAFAWNECEQLSMRAAATGEEAVAISRFWRRHTPILLSVDSGYEYLAVRDDGAVVHGSEPEFEESVVVFPRFEDLLKYTTTSPTRPGRVGDRLLFGATHRGVTNHRRLTRR